MADISIDNDSFQVAIEPDGRFGHWFELPKKYKSDVVEVDLEITKDWPDPILPNDIKSAFINNPISREMWAKITPKARWEWLRWIRSTVNPETRKKRIDASIDKMKKGMRRPCCFNQNMCTVPEVSKSGQLLAAEESDS